MSNLASINEQRRAAYQRKQEAEARERERLAAEQTNIKEIEDAEATLAFADFQERQLRTKQAIDDSQALKAQNNATVAEFQALLDEMEQFIGDRWQTFAADFDAQQRRHEQLVNEGLSNGAQEAASPFTGRSWESLSREERRQMEQMTQQQRSSDWQLRQKFPNPLPRWAAVSQWVANCPASDQQRRLVRQAVAYVYLQRLISPSPDYSAQADVDDVERRKFRGGF